MPAPKFDELVLVYRTPNGVAVRSLALVLEDAGIDVRIVGDFRDGAYPGLAIGSMADKELWISAKDRTVAAPIAAEWRRIHDPELPAEPQPKFQFSMWAALIAMTLVAVIAAIQRGLAILTGDRDVYSLETTLGITFQVLFGALMIAVSAQALRRMSATFRRVFHQGPTPDRDESAPVDT